MTKFGEQCDMESKKYGQECAEKVFEQASFGVRTHHPCVRSLAKQLTVLGAGWVHSSERRRSILAPQDKRSPVDTLEAGAWTATWNPTEAAFLLGAQLRLQ